MKHKHFSLVHQALRFFRSLPIDYQLHKLWDEVGFLVKYVICDTRLFEEVVPTSL
jgi:hypothetical protein